MKTSSTELEQRLPALELDWLLGQLCQRPGICTVRHVGDARLAVEYDADELVVSDVVEFLSECGVRAAAMQPIRP